MGADVHSDRGMDMKVAAVTVVALVAALLVIVLLQDDDLDATGTADPSTTSDDPVRGHDTDARPENTATPGRTDGVATQSYGQQLRFQGTVRSRSDASPVADADITVTTMPLVADAPPMTARSDADGRFEIAARSAEARPSRLHVRITAQGFLDFETTVAPPADDDATGVFFLSRDRVYVVRFVDPQGNAVPHARLTLVRNYDARFRLERTADAEGCVTLRNSELFTGYWLLNQFVMLARADDRADAFGAFRGRTQVPKTVVLHPASWLEGRVVDKETEAGVSGAEIFFSSWAASQDLPDDIRRLQLTRTDASGRFRLPLVTRAGTMPLSRWCEASGYHPFMEQAGSKLGTLKTLIELQKPRVKLRKFLVLDRDTKQALGNRELTLHRFRKRSPVTTDPEGRFSHEVPAHGVSLQAEGYRREFIRIQSDAPPESEVTVQLTPGVTIRQRVRVIDELSRPVEGAHVKMSYKVVKRSGSQDSWTDASGHTTFEFDIDPGAECRLSVDCPGYCAVKSEPFPLGEVGQDVRTLVLERGSVFPNLQVVDGDGAPLADQSVVAEFTVSGGPTRKLYATSDPDGYCVLAFPRFDKGRLYVSERPDTLVEITHAQIVANERIVLVVSDSLPARSSIRGVVQDARGEPLRMIMILQYEARTADSASMRGYRGSTMTESDGTFRLPAFEGKRYRLKLPRTRRDDLLYEADEVPLVSVGADIRITMRPFFGVVASFDVVRDDARNYGDPYDVWLEDAQGRRLEAEEVVKERYRVYFRNPPPGRLRVVATTPEPRRYASPVVEVQRGTVTRTKVRRSQ